LEIAREYPAVLVNSVFQDNDENASLLENFRYIAVRESRSADYVRAFGFDVDVVPDVIFASAFVRAYTKNAPVNDIGMSDSVFRQKFRFGPFKWKRAFGFPAQCSVVEYLKMLESYRRLCIGRFHGVVLASMLGIPFSSWESNTWKISGLMRDMGAEHLHFATQRDAVRAVPCVFPLQIREFVDAAPARIERMFDHIASLAKR
jgi:polysaccharide pyruvyl transferase WcaK-like protein